jgi:hypothetical protein
MNNNSAKIQNTLLLKVEDLNALGKSYENQFRLALKQDNSIINLISIPFSKASIWVMMMVNATFFLSITTFLLYEEINSNKPNYTNPLLVFGIGLFTIGLIIYSLFTHTKKLQEINPLLTFDKNTQIITILNGKFSTSIDKIYGIIACTVPDSTELYSELQIIVDENGTKTRYLIHGSAYCSKYSYKKILTEFGKLSKIQTILVDYEYTLWPNRLSGRGPLKISILTPDLNSNDQLPNN